MKDNDRSNKKPVTEELTNDDAVAGDNPIEGSEADYKEPDACAACNACKARDEESRADNARNEESEAGNARNEESEADNKLSDNQSTDRNNTNRSKNGAGNEAPHIHKTVAVNKTVDGSKSVAVKNTVDGKNAVDRKNPVDAKNGPPKRNQNSDGGTESGGGRKDARDTEDTEVEGEKIADDQEELNIVGVRFEPTGKTYDYIQNDVELRCGDWCIVEMEKGEEITRVFRLTPSDRRKPGGHKPLRKIIRKATQQDLEQARRNEELGKKAQVACQKKIVERGLPMKLIKVKYSFDASKAVFYFTAEGRIDFRDLVKDLAVRFKTRIEMRQIGVRDEARMISGFGCCGRQLCCSLFLRDFEPVSIRMAKDQCLTLNPGKISGICGRLMCCLVYEASVYEEVRRKLPKLGERVLVNNEEGKVISFDILKGLAFVEFPDGRVLKLPGSSIQRIKGEQQPKKPPKKSQKQDSGKQAR